MRAILLAGGLGTRLRPVTNHTPKCLVAINGKPLLDYWLEMLFKAGVERVLINTHYLSEKVERHVADSKWRDQIELVFEEELLLTGGTVLANRNFTKGQSILVAHADNLTSFDVQDFWHAHDHRPDGAEITMMTFDAEKPENCGIIETDENGVVTAFHEKVTSPPGNHANAAIYIFEPSVLEFLSSFNKKKIDLSTEVIPRYMGRIITYHNDQYVRDIGDVTSLEQAEYDLKHGCLKGKYSCG